MRNKKQLFEALKPSEIRPYMGLDRRLANQRIENVWDNLKKIATFLGKRDKEALDLLKKYAGEKSLLSIGDDYLIVISKHPYDIVGMSTDRNWTSCMNIRDDKVSQYNKYLPLDITQGTIVSYLIKRHDLNIKRPIARILIKPYYSIDKRTDILYGVEYDSFTKYGLHNKNYPKTLLRIFDYCQKGKTGVFVQDSKLYDSNNAVPIVNDVYYQRKIDKLSKQTSRLLGNLTPERLFIIAPWLAEASFSNAVFSVQHKNNDDDDLKIIFLEGEWYDGDWIDGKFFGGTWHNGTWHNGIFNDSRWENGRWLNGTFTNNSRWNDGTWHKGTFTNDSTWNNGTWHDGIFNYSTWNNGTWHNGTFKDSRWFYGTFVMGFWRDGKWFQGEWHEGEIFDHEIKTFVKSYYPPR